MLPGRAKASSNGHHKTPGRQRSPQRHVSMSPFSSISSDSDESRLKRVHSRTIHKTLREAIIDMNIPVHRSEIEIVMTVSSKNECKVRLWK